MTDLTKDLYFCFRDGRTSRGKTGAKNSAGVDSTSTDTHRQQMTHLKETFSTTIKAEDCMQDLI